MSTRNTPPDEDLFLALRETGDQQAREALLRRYLPLARHTARRFQRGHEPLDDLFQVASYALLKAIDGFDPSRGLAFTSYAVPSVTGELKRHLRDTGWGMRVGRGVQERALSVERAIADLTPELRRSPTPAEIAHATGLTSEQVLEAAEASSNYVLESLDNSVSSDGDAYTRLDTLGGIDPGYELIDELETIGPALRELPFRERQILAWRFGEELSQSQIARRLGVSQMQVSRLLRRTLDELSQRVETEANEAALEADVDLSGPRAIGRGLVG